jgi:hypothetical protein
MKKFFPVLPKDKASSSESNKVIDFEILETDPSRRPAISSYHPDIQNDVRKAYLKKGPHQPVNFDFPWTTFGRQRRRFGKHWFDLYNWLEYSESSDKGYCLPCFLFKNVSKCGGNHFVGEGFNDWKNPQRLLSHVTDPFSSHTDCVQMGHNLMNPKQSIGVAFAKQNKTTNVNYRVRVTTSLVGVKYLLRCGFPFRGSKESSDALYKGPFLELIDAFKEINEDVANVLNSAPLNNLMTCSIIICSI